MEELRKKKRAEREAREKQEVRLNIERKKRLVQMEELRKTGAEREAREMHEVRINIERKERLVQMEELRKKKRAEREAREKQRQEFFQNKPL